MSSIQPSSFSKQFASLEITGIQLTGKILGKGSDATVKEVNWVGTSCAAKQLHEILLEDDSAGGAKRFVDNFEKECMTWSKLTHPHIVQFLGVCFLSARSRVPMLILEKMNISLRRFLEDHTKENFVLPDKIYVLRQVAQALSYLHSRSPPLVHHDLSPNNILLNEVSLQAKVTDFGMTRAMDPSKMSRKSSVKGTQAFMSPEALVDPPKYSEKLDVFSYGNVIITVVTHKWPNPQQPTRLEGKKLIAVSELERRQQYLLLFTPKENELFLPIVGPCLQNDPTMRPTSIQLVTQMRGIEESHPRRAEDSTVIPQLRQDLQLKDEQLREKDQQLHEKDQQLKLKDDELQHKDEKSGRQYALLLHEHQQLQQERDQLCRERDQLQRESNRSLSAKPVAKPKQFCGYLACLETHKLRKTWKNRWFHLDEYLGKLFYYEDKTSLIPLGFIDLSNVTFSCDVEHLSSGRFSIATPVTTHHLQAQNSYAMRYWLDQLQKTRKNVMRSEHQDTDSTDSHLGSMATEDPSGLVGEELDTTLLANDRNDIRDDEDRILDSVALDKPVPVPVENKRRFPVLREALFPVSTMNLEKEVGELKETVEAYREINMFLSKEVASLQELRSADSARMLELTDTITYLETEITRLKSKLVALLNEQDALMLMSSSETAMQKQEVPTWLREAMESGTLMTPEDDLKPTPEKKEVTVDHFGFKSKADSDMSASLQSFEMIDFKEVQHIPPYSPQQRRDTLTQEWMRFFRNHGNIESDLPRTEELKNLIRKGIPVPKYRAQVWRACIKDLLKKKHLGFLTDVYKDLLETHADDVSPALGQIEQDLLQALPNNVYFDNPEAKGILKLRRILVAYSWYNPEVGYCQGLNRLAAIALLFLDEEWAFWCLVAIVQCIQPPGYYTKNLVGSQADQRVLQQIMSQKAPRVARHLSAYNIDYSPITFNWFLTLFVNNMPPETMIRIWDSFLYEGSKILFRFAIAIFKYHEDELLHYHDPIELYSFLSKMSLRVVDIDRLSRIAFNELNPFPMKKISELRLHYQPTLQVEGEQ